MLRDRNEAQLTVTSGIDWKEMPNADIDCGKVSVSLAPDRSPTQRAVRVDFDALLPKAARQNAQEAVELWLDTAKQFGDPVPAPGRRRPVFA